jgi:transposase-like protein
MPVVLEPVHCPTCQETQIVKHGKSAAGKQRYKCCNPDCIRKSFILNYTYQGSLPSVKHQITEMTLNGSGIRDTARVLKISPTTVIEVLKKRTDISSSQRRVNRTIASYSGCRCATN